MDKTAKNVEDAVNISLYFAACSQVAR